MKFKEIEYAQQVSYDAFNGQRQQDYQQPEACRRCRLLLLRRPGSNPGPWVPKRSAMTTALHARLGQLGREKTIICFNS
jgi:hypothetical protein